MKERSLLSLCRYKHGVVPIAIGMKVETLPAVPSLKLQRSEAGEAGKEDEGSAFIIQLPLG